MMTDQEIIQGLIERNNWITRQFFFVKSRPLLTSILKAVFDKHFKYEEMVNELYLYLMEKDCSRLRQFKFRSSVYQWLKVVALRYFLQKRAGLIENDSQEPLIDKASNEETADTAETVSDRIDVSTLLKFMNNQRYATVIQYLILEDMEPERCATLMGVTVDNLYNIKKRAMTAITRVAIKYYSYGK